MGPSPAIRTQICGAYHSSDSPAETTHTRHHRGTPGTFTLAAAQVFLGHANRVQPYPQTATGYPKSSPSGCESCESSASLPDLFPYLRLSSVRRNRGPSLAGASLIDHQDLATVNMAIGRRPRVCFSIIVIVPGRRCVCGPRSGFPSPVSFSAWPEGTYSAPVSCDGFLCFVNLHMAET